MKTLNLIGREISKLRNQAGWTQDSLGDRLQLAGWINITRNDVSRVEGRSVYVADLRVFYLPGLFPVDLAALFPKINLEAPMEETIARLTRNDIIQFAQ